MSGAGESDALAEVNIDIMRDVYMTTKQREAYNRILAAAYDNAIAARAAAQGAAVDYVPGNLDRTAPTRVWLQIDVDGDNEQREESWPGADVVTWQDTSIGGLEIQYVRADLAALGVDP